MYFNHISITQSFRQKLTGKRDISQKYNLLKYFTYIYVLLKTIVEQYFLSCTENFYHLSERMNESIEVCLSLSTTKIMS